MVYFMYPVVFCITSIHSGYSDSDFIVNHTTHQLSCGKRINRYRAQFSEPTPSVIIQEHVPIACILHAKHCIVLREEDS